MENSLQETGDEGKDSGEKIKDGTEDAEEGMDGLKGKTEDTKGSFKDFGAAAQLGLQNVMDGARQAMDGIQDLGRNLMETLNLAGQQEQQETFLKMNIGAEGAAKQMKIINDLVADLPGDDVAIGGILSQAAAKNAGITADELKRMGTNAADYFAAMANYGKSSIEAQQDLTNYIMTGNTAELERSPVLQAHIDKLKEAGTVEERNKALQEAMNEEGWSGISMQDTYNNKLETFTATLERGKRQVGELFLDAAGGAMDFIGQLDQATGGVLGMGIAIGTVAGGPLVQTITGIGQMATGFKALQTAMEGTAIANALAEGSFWSLAASELAALWPVVAIVGALIALGLAVYEVGKYFGWWTDVGSMIDAISAGLQRLWSAFINHPDVQSFLSALSGAWNMLSAAVGRAISWVGSFFNNNSSGKFDIVRALIDGIGLAWKQITMPIRLVITVVKLLGTTVRTAGKNIQNVINNIKGWFRALPGAIRGAISSIASILLAPFTSGYNSIKGIVNNIISAANSITKGINLGGLANKLTAPFSSAYNSIVGWAKKTYSDAQKWYNSITSGGARGGEDLGGAYGGVDLPFNNTTYTNGTLKVTNDVNLTLDLRNVPSNIDETTLKNALLEGLTNKEVLSTLVNNNDFQTLDKRAKDRIMMRNNRARGV